MTTHTQTVRAILARLGIDADPASVADRMLDVYGEGLFSPKTQRERLGLVEAVREAAEWVIASDLGSDK